jgi:glycogen(starch) synthase
LPGDRHLQNLGKLGLNIYLLSREYPPETGTGGIGTYTYNTASALVKLGHYVQVMTATRFSEHIFQDNGVWVHKINRRSIRPKECDLISYSYSVARRLRRARCRPDIIQSSEFEGEAFWLSLHKKCPLITRLATPLFLIDKLNGRAFFGPRPILNWIEKRQTEHSAGILTSTRALARTVSAAWNISPARIEIIPNSLDLPRIIRLADEHRPPDLLRNKDFLLYFGRLEERKGVRVLAQALPAVFEEFPNLSAVFIGSDLGYQGASMRECIMSRVGEFRDRIIFMDQLPQEKLFPIVGLAKLVVLPSLWEAFGFVTVEAMALGRPVIATSGSGFEEIIEDGVSGYLVRPGDSQALAEKIVNVLRDETNRRLVSEGARVRARDYEVSAVAVRLVEYYQRVRARWLARDGAS